MSLADFEPYVVAMSLPQTWQGAVEICIVATLLLAAQNLARPGWRFIAMAVPVELYLRRHGVDVSALIDLVYLEILLGTGFVVLSRMHVATRTVAGYLQCLVLGLAVWSFLAWTMSALGPGSVRALRALTVLLGIVVIAHRTPLVSTYVFRRTFELKPAARSVVLLMGVWSLVLFAKTGVAINFDALWYSLRGEQVLVGTGSVFKSAGLVNAVYYFPKFYELLLIPVSGLGSSSVIAGLSIGMLAMFAFACHAIVARLGITSVTMRLAIVLLCITLPVVANCAVDPKPDLLAAALLLITAIHAGDYLATRCRSALLWAGACALLAVQCKLVALPYAGLMAIAFAIGLVRQRNDRVRPVSPIADRSAWLVFSLSLAVTILVTLRTLVLAGVPTIGPDALFHVWRALGFDLKFPAGSMLWTFPQNWNDVPLLVFDVLFRPQRAEHIVNFWTGNVWLWALLAITFFVPVRAQRAFGSSPLVAMAFCGLILLCSTTYSVRGGDGNYYLAAVAAATLFGVSTLAIRMGHARILLGCITVFTVFDAGYAFLNSDWTSGTRAFDLNFRRAFVEFRRDNRQLMLNSGLAGIDTYLRHIKPYTRVVGCLPDEIDMRIGARTESIQQIAYSRHDFLASESNFLHFLHDDMIRFLIVPHDASANTYCVILPGVHRAITRLANDASVTRIDDRDYVMYDLDAWLKKPLQ